MAAHLAQGASAFASATKAFNEKRRIGKVHARAAGAVRASADEPILLRAARGEVAPPPLAPPSPLRSGVPSDTGQAPSSTP